MVFISHGNVFIVACMGGGGRPLVATCLSVDFTSHIEDNNHAWIYVLEPCLPRGH